MDYSRCKNLNFVIFHPYEKSFDYLPQLKIFDTDTSRDVSLEIKIYVKYLGILIDKNFSWKMHIDNVATKLRKTVGLIAKLRHFVSSATYLAKYLPCVNLSLFILRLGGSLGTGVKNTFNQNLITSEESSPIYIFCQQEYSCNSFFYYCLYFKSVSYLLHDIHTNSAPTKIVNLFSQISSIHSRPSSKNDMYIKNLILKN